MSKPNTPTCSIDRDVLNENTVGQMDDLGLSVFAKLCGFNRGAFVLDPPDGKTYGCTSFPESFSTNAGISAEKAIPDSANLTQTFTAGNITASATVDIVDEYISSVYSSSDGLDNNPFGCDVNGLATLGNCESSTSTAKSLRPDGDIVKAVTLAGAFIPQPWATGGKVLSMDEVKDFYSSRDFREMADLGVNTVQIPVPCEAFYVNGEVASTVTKLLAKAERAGLSAILVLVESDVEGITAEMIDNHIKSAAAFASESSNVIALQLPTATPSLLGAVRGEDDKLPVLVPTDKGHLNQLSFPPDSYLFAALDVSASSSVADVASSDSVGDRMKMFYHESITCIDRSPIEWLECYRDMPVYVTSGFDLGIDDCVNEDDESFKDYGQCDRFDETTDSGWWGRHRLSLASRQLFAYSKGLGWTFSAWKLYAAETDGVIDSPAELLCLRDVAAAGLMPELSSTSNSSALGAACLNGPKADFAMGDATFAPTPAPHDCGNGWWNVSTSQCDYWVPPPPAPTPTDYPTLAKGAVGGAVVALALAWLVKKMTSRDAGYQTLP